MLRSSRSRRMVFGLGICLLLLSCGGDYWLGGRTSGAAGSAGAGGSGGASNRTTYDLDGDIVLTGGDARELGNCRIIGNGHSIRSVAPWYGSLWIHDCEIIGLGTATVEAISVAMTQTGWTKIERSSFATSG